MAKAGWIFLNTILSFILTSLIIELTPGPNMAYLVILSITEGRKAGFSAVLGIGLGLLLIGLTAALGVAELITSSNLVYQLLRWAGVIYLLWLAWEGWNASERVRIEDNRSFNQTRFFLRGFITNVLNPKAALFYVAILPAFVNGGPTPVLIQTINLTTVYVFLATTIHISIVALAGTVRIFLNDPARIILTHRILSLLLAGIAFWFALTTGKMPE